MIEFPEDTGFGPIPEAVYTATCQDFEFGESSQKGTPFVQVTYQITGPSYANRLVWEKYYLTPKAMWRLKQLLVACGAMDEGFSGSFDETQIPALCGGCEVAIQVVHEKADNGKTYHNVESVSKPIAAGAEF